MVVDTNSLDSNELKLYLEKSEHHLVVLTEWPLIEALNGKDPVYSLEKRFELCKKHISQFVLLKEAPILARLSGRQSGLLKRMINPNGSAALAKFLGTISKAAQHDPKAIGGIHLRKSDAEAFLEGLLNSGEEYTRWYSVFQREYSDADLKIIRKDEPYNRSIWIKMTKAIRDLTGYFLSQQDGTVKWPRPSELPNIFFYRLALMLQLHFFDWIASGSPQDRKADKFKNDQLDVLIGVSATYFDGIITNDKKLERIYHRAAWFLENYSIPLSRRVESKDKPSHN